MPLRSKVSQPAYPRIAVAILALMAGTLTTIMLGRTTGLTVLITTLVVLAARKLAEGRAARRAAEAVEP